MTDLEKYITECIERNEDYQSDYSGCVEAEYGNIYISCHIIAKSVTERHAFFVYSKLSIYRHILLQGASSSSKKNA